MDILYESIHLITALRNGIHVPELEVSEVSKFRSVQQLRDVSSWVYDSLRWLYQEKQQTDPKKIFSGDTTITCRFENIVFFVQVLYTNSHIDLCIFIFDSKHASVQLRLSRTKKSALLSGLYPSYEREGWEFFGVKSVGRFLLKIVDWICIAVEVDVIELIDCATLDIGTQDPVKLSLLMLLATGKTYYEGSGYVPLHMIKLGHVYHRLETDRRTTLYTLFGRQEANQLLYGANIRCGNNDLLVHDYVEIILHKLFTKDKFIIQNIHKILTIIQSKFEYSLISLRYIYLKRYYITEDNNRCTKHMRRIRSYPTNTAPYIIRQRKLIL